METCRRSLRPRRPTNRWKYLEALELRTLLSAYLIPVSNHTDLIFDPIRNQLDIPSSTGLLTRFDVSTKALLSAFTVGGTLGAGDITSDGSAIYLTDTAALTLHKVLLSSGSASAFTYVGASLESAGYDLAITSGGLAMFDGQFAGSGWVPLRTVDLATDTLDVYVPDPYPNNQVRQNTHIYRSANGSTLYFAESNISSGPLSVYDSASRTVVARYGIGVSLSSALGAASRDGSQLALSVSGSTTIRDRSLNVIKTNLPAGILAYNPVRDTLYILPSGSTSIQAYDSKTFALKGTFDASEAYSFSGPGNPMVLSADGSTLFVATATGVRMVNVDESHLVPVSLTTSLPAVATSSPVTLTAGITYPSALPGTVRFMDGTVTLATVPLVNNIANYSTSTLTAGIHNLTAIFVDGVIGSGSPSSISPLIVTAAGTPATLIPVTDHTDIIYDGSRNQLDIVASNGNLFRYSLSTNQFLTSLHMNGNPGYGDITPDGSFLYLTDLSGTTIHKVNLTTNAVTDLTYNGASLESASFDLAILTGNKALFDSKFAGSGWVDVRTIDLATDLISQGTTAISSVRQDTRIFRSADRTTALFTEANISSGPITLYNALDNSIVGSFNTDSFLSGPIGAVSRDGSLLAYSLSNTIVRNRAMQVVASLPAGAISFNPVRDVLYILPTGATVVSAYDTSTFKLKGTYDLGQTFSSGTNTGIMTLSDDGNKLFVTTTTGIRAINVAAMSVNPAVTLSVPVFSITFGKTLTLSASMASPTPLGGFVRFFDGSTLLATVVNNSSNTATYSTTALTTGSHDLTASYFDGGNANGLPSAVNTVLVTSATLPANLLPVTDHADLLFDSTRQQLLIPAGTGTIYRYNVVTRQFLQAYHVTGKPGYGDITADGHFLYLTDQTGTTIHKIDLNSGAVTELPYSPGFYEGGGWDLALTADKAVFDGQFNGSGWVSVRTIDLATDAFGTTAPIPDVRQNTGIFRSADGSTFFFTESNSSAGPISVYDSALNAVVASISTGTFLSGPQAALNSDGSLIALATGNKTTVRDRLLNTKTAALPGGPVGFNPATGTLYIIPSGTANVNAYDPVTFTLKATYAIGQTVALDGTRNGIITVSPDGGTLYVTTSTGVRTVAVAEKVLPNTSLTLSSPTIHFGDPLTLTATNDNPAVAGVIRFQEGATILATITVAAGQAAFTTNSLSVGGHDFTAVFIDAFGQSAKPSAIAHATVIPLTTTLALSIKTPGTPSIAPTFHVSVSGNPAGIVDLLEGNTILATATLDSGAADLTPAAPLPLGSHSVTAYFRGNANVNPATSAPVILGVNALATTTTLASSALTIDEDKNFTLTATVASQSIPTGTVTFFDGQTPLATRTLNAAGIATFICSLPTGGPHQLTAQYNGSTDYLPSVSDALTEHIQRVPRKLLYIDPITTVPAGGTFTLRLAITDNQNEVVDNYSRSISIAILAMTGGGALGGQLTVQAVNGIATFAGLFISKPGTYALRATDGLILFADLPGIVITPPATHLAFAGTTGTIIAGQLIAPVSVQFLDATNHLVAMDGPTTISLTKPNGATLAGTLTVDAHDGTAIFNDLTITKAGSYTFSVAFNTLSTVVSKSFTVIPDASSAHLIITTQPANSPLDKALPTITVSIKDQFDNLITTDSSTVTLAIVSGPDGATLKGTLSAKASKGVAKFAGIIPSQIGDYTLSLSDGALAPVSTNSVNVYFVPKKLLATPLAGSVGQAQGIASFQVSTVDAKGRLITTSNALVTLTLTAPKGAVVHGTMAVAAVNGIATFADLWVDVPGTYTFKVTCLQLPALSLHCVIKAPLA